MDYMCRTGEKTSSTFHLRSILHILGISCQDRVSNAAVLPHTGLPSMYTLFRQRRVRWLSHIYRMEDGLIPKDILNGELASRKRPTGCPQLRYKEVCMRDVKALDIITESWERLAADHARWRRTLNQHLKTGEKKLMSAAADKPAPRKECSSSSRSTTTFRCDRCDRDCHSSIDLFSHK
ncbi:hypothetical protein chiPu_0011021 [Chiloscyllium punctatum]|uniref:Uncharacterized protein n=1 Tax=Chiloscyllium punctatum TaxID=137246 RepID=A0A401SQ69_CHIPU|nr:hypothetical protein [Chiloscyllium punctatum]